MLSIRAQTWHESIGNVLKLKVPVLTHDYYHVVDYATLQLVETQVGISGVYKISLLGCVDGIHRVKVQVALARLYLDDVQQVCLWVVGDNVYL